MLKRVAALAVLLFASISLVAAQTPPTPPNAPGAEAGEWYVSPKGQSEGPFAVSVLETMAREGGLFADTPVWKQGWPAWKALSDTPELQNVLALIPQAPPGPPPPPSAQQSLDEAAKRFIAGVWRFEGNVTQGGFTLYAVVEITYRPDGSYSGYQSLQSPGYGGVQPPPSVTSRLGQWQVSGIDKMNFNLKLIERGAGPSEARLRIVDENTLENVNDLTRSYRIR